MGEQHGRAGREVTLRVPDMACQACERLISYSLQQLGGVLHVQADARSKTVRVHVRADLAIEDLLERIRAAGYEPEFSG